MLPIKFVEADGIMISETEMAAMPLRASSSNNRDEVPPKKLLLFSDIFLEKNGVWDEPHIRTWAQAKAHG